MKKISNRQTRRLTRIIAIIMVMTLVGVFVPALPARAGSDFTATGVQVSINSNVQGSRSYVKITEGVYTFSSMYDSNYVLDVYGGNIWNGTNIAVYKKTGADNQKFRIVNVSGYWYKIETASRSVLDVKGGQAGNGVNVQQWEYNGTDSQLFRFCKTSSGTYIIENKLGYVLDIAGGKAKDGKNIHTWTMHGGKSQQWILSNESFDVVTPEGQLSWVNEGVYTLKSAYDSNYVLDLYGAKTANGTNIAVYKSTSANNQKFRITKATSYWYKIEAECGKVLDVKDGKKSKGTNIQLWEYNGTDSQLFCFYKTSAGTVIIQNKLGCVIDISGGKALDGKNVHTWRYHGGKSQQWILSSTNFKNKKVKNTKLSYGLYRNSAARVTCGFNGYKTTSGKHEGIDIHYKIGAPIYALTDGVVVRVVYGKCGGHGLSTIAIYNKAAKKTVVYLHSAPVSGLKAGQTVRRGQRIGVESWRGITRSSGAHTHVEVRNGRVGYAAKSVNDYKLDNQNPASFWKGQGYTIN